MTDPFSIVAGTIGIGAAFSACVDCFKFIQFGRHFARDFQTHLLTLNCVKLRLTRWGAAVDVFDDPQLGNPKATELEIQTAKQILHQILHLFTETEKVSKRRRLGIKFGEDLSVCSPDKIDAVAMVLNDKLGELAVKRQKSAGIFKTASWALYDRANFAELIAGVTSLMDNLEKLFPATEARTELARVEALELSKTQGVARIQSLPCGLDAMLQAAVNEAVTGHRYSNTIIKGHVQAGDLFSADWSEGSVGVSHVYDGTLIEAGGKALMGNTYGGRGFWDD